MRNGASPSLDLAEQAPTSSWLARIDHWRTIASLAIPAWDALRVAENDVLSARDELEKERSDLADALASAGIAAGDLPLPSLLQAAENLLAEHAARQTKRADRDTRVTELERGLTDRKAALDASLAADEEWRRGWADALDLIWFADRGQSIEAIGELVDALAELPGAVLGQNDMQHRADAMEQDREAFTCLVADIHAELGESVDAPAPVDAAGALARRREEARRALAKSNDLKAALQWLASERQGLADEIALHTARASRMTDFSGVETLAQVHVCIERCSARDRLSVDLERLKCRIATAARQQSVQEALALLSSLDASALRHEHTELSGQLEDTEAQAQILYANMIATKDRLDAVGADAAVARIESERRTILIEIEDLALRFLRLRTGGLVAEQALRNYRESDRSTMMRRASEAFGLMTRGEYSGLATRPEKDRELLIGLSRHGGSKLAVDMSKGTRFQLYLALRLAGYEEFAMLRPPVPFIADDIMETFDEPRPEAVFELLSRMASVGQVIYLTHHRHLCEIAQKSCQEPKCISFPKRYENE